MLVRVLTIGESLMRVRAASLFLLLAAAPLAGQTPAKRPLRVGDMYQVKTVSGPQISPDGKWVAYVVTTTDSAKDKSDSDIWMTSWDGSETIRVTSSPDGESSPRWSPDGRYLAFLSSRQGGKGSQLWLLDRRGGEAQRVTELKTGIEEYEWSPDSKRIALVMSELRPDADSANKKPKPIVIDRYHFKNDGDGYLDSTRSAPLSVRRRDAHVDAPHARTVRREQSRLVARRQVDRVREQARPRRPRSLEQHRRLRHRSARRARAAKQLTTFAGPDGGPLAWSPDGSLDRVSPRQRAEVQRVQRGPTRGRSRGRRRVAHAHRVARPSGDVAAFHRRREVDHVSRHRRSRALPRAAFPSRGGAVQKLTDGRRVIGASVDRRRRQDGGAQLHRDAAERGVRARERRAATAVAPERRMARRHRARHRPRT